MSTKEISVRTGSTRKLTVTAMFAAVAAVLMYFEFPLPFMPPFLKIDLSGAVVMIAALMFGPWPAVAVTLIKDLVHLMSTKTGGVGELADFLILSCFAITASAIYERSKDKKHAFVALGSATGVMAVVAVLANKFLLIPFYSRVMPMEAIIGACQAMNPAIDSLNAYYIFGVLPFNLIKGTLLSVVTILLYKRLSVIIKRT